MLATLISLLLLTVVPGNEIADQVGNDVQAVGSDTVMPGFDRASEIADQVGNDVQAVGSDTVMPGSDRASVIPGHSLSCPA